MTTQAADLGKERLVQSTKVIGGARFDWGMIAVCAWLTAGGYADAWAHNHIPSLETFFTPWHGVLYSGVLAVNIYLGVTFVRNLRLGSSPLHAMPAGYELSLLGAILFVFAGFGDMIWHILFGIERNVEATLSPTHLAAAIAFTLVVSGPFRAAWKRRGSQLDFVSLLPMLLSLTFTIALITLISQMTHPFVHLWPTYANKEDFAEQALAVAGIILQTIVLMGFVLLAVRRWQLPFGSFTLVLTLNIAMLSFMQDHYVMIIPAALAGLTMDVLVQRLRPSIKQPGEFRLFAFMAPVILYLLYFLTLVLTTGVVWSIHLWLGSTLVAGLAGFLLSYLLIPPAMPQGEER